MTSRVRVAVRVRPFTAAETKQGTPSCISMTNSSTILKFGQIRQFTYDYSFWSHDGYTEDPSSGALAKSDELSQYADQWSVYEAIGEPILNNAEHGFNACIFAYGQTGSGKSYTMVGNEKNPGLIPLFCQELFAGIAEIDDPSRVVTLEVNMFEIYNEKIYDLLQADRNSEVDVKETPVGFFFDGLSLQKVDNYEQLQGVIDLGNAKRTIAATKMNDTSSRAHTIYRLTLTQSSVDRNTGEEFDSLNSEINLVDLAGSERVGQTGASGDRFDEGTKINWSLSNLRNVITALTSKHYHIPYRDSRLTFILKNALGGNSKTAMIATISPAVEYASQTLSTLKYAQQVKFIENKAIINVETSDPELARLKQELASLEEAIRERDRTVEELRLRISEFKGAEKQASTKSTKSQNTVRKSACCTLF